MWCYTVLFICTIGFIGNVVSTDNEVYRISLDTTNTMNLFWQVNYKTDELSFEVHISRTFGWFALGFSDYGELFPADYCILWYNWKHESMFQDVYTDENGIVFLDKQQDCRRFRMQRGKNESIISYTRKFDTCDRKDYIIEDGTTHVVWSMGNGPLYKASGLNISTEDDFHGMVRVQLLKNNDVNYNLPNNAEQLDIVGDTVTIPNVETTYWCQVFKIPEKMKKKHHIIQYEPIISEEGQGYVHHMEVFHCIAPVDEEMPDYVGSCFSEDRPPAIKVCKRVLAAWAMGAKAFVYPDEAGLPLGGPDFNPYLLLEIHYNNPDFKMGPTGLKDRSGIRFHVISELRQFDAGIVELGLEYTDKMAIPPNEEMFPLSGYCTPECTAVSLPPNGINIFGSQLHTHLTGVAVVTRHIRNGRELPELNRDSHYSQHFQEIRMLKRVVNVLPGDALITTCTYKTVDRPNVTLGGFAISDEMCVNYAHYYPETKLEVCKSAISDKSLENYFSYMNEWENQETSPSKVISENYKAIKWNRIRAKLLGDFYNEAPLSMQCNMSSGDRFPGYWEHTPRPHVLLPLPAPKRNCDL